MKSVNIMLSATDQVQTFVNIANRFPFPLKLRQEQYTVDGKSIMGIFRLDRTRPITLDILSDDYPKVIDALQPLLAV